MEHFKHLIDTHPLIALHLFAALALVIGSVALGLVH
jgi:hypothetical protein